MRQGNNGDPTAANARKSSLSSSASGTGISRKDSNTSGSTSASSSKSKPSIEINVANFPPLQQDEAEFMPTPGFKTEVIKYSFDDIINIVKSIQEAQLPDSIKPVSRICLTPINELC